MIPCAYLLSLISYVNNFPRYERKMWTLMAPKALCRKLHFAQPPSTTCIIWPWFHTMVIWNFPQPVMNPIEDCNMKRCACESKVWSHVWNLTSLENDNRSLFEHHHRTNVEMCDVFGGRTQTIRPIRNPSWLLFSHLSNKRVGLVVLRVPYSSY